MDITPIARIRSDFPEKFGLPRQSGLVEELTATVVFEPPYRDASALRGLEGFSHIWLIWEFSKARRAGWSPTVRPPRLGGNRRLGVFATRSPFRPNPIGLSCVRLAQMRQDRDLGPVLVVAGADLMDGTPIYDIKPYLPYADCKPEAVGGFAAQPKGADLEVVCPAKLLEAVPEEKRAALLAVLAQDPRPQYQDDPARVYGMSFAGLEVRFRVEGERLAVTEILQSRPPYSGWNP
ncbi:MAG: tRNA (N6-threonylcarbamoyladenosine(37)-N6)-methyltransferase TrmO [Lawsonibacter sp.]|nr:tRNA (N6-threonylcarbamoyladenosine(37)-N6)-methyltransferase TrmO [Lawsonibacter sp.]